MATAYKRAGLTGGTSTDLDGIDGTNLADGDFAFTLDGTDFYVHLLDDDSGAAESSPGVIQPDTNGGTKRWIQQAVQNVSTGVSPPSGVEITGNVAGMVMSNDTDTDHDISFSAGSCMDSTNVYHMTNSSAVVKRIDATWAAGTANGGLLNGSVAASTLYHCYALRKDSDGTADFGFLADGDAIATYKPVGYTYYRWVGYVVTDASANIRNFTMNNNVITYLNAYTAISSIQSLSLTAQDFSSDIPDNRTSKIHIGLTASVNENIDIGPNSTEATWRLVTSVSTTWTNILGDHDMHEWFVVNPTSSTALYFNTNNDPVNCWIKEVEIIR